MNEIFPRVNPRPEDEKKMEHVLYQAKEILANAVADDREKKINVEKKNKNFPKLDPMSDDEEKMEHVLHEVKEILTRATEDDKNRKNEKAAAEFNFFHDEYEEHDEDFFGDDKISSKELEEMKNTLEKLQGELLDESSDFYTNVDKGSVDELFYKTLAEEIPSLNISLDEKAVDIDGLPLKDHVAVKTIPYKTDRVFLSGLEHNPAIHALKHPKYCSEEEKKELEELGILPKNFVDRALAKEYEFRIKKWPDSENFWREQLARLGNVTSFSDEEIQEIMRKVILDEFKKRL